MSRRGRMSAGFTAFYSLTTQPFFKNRYLRVVYYQFMGKHILKSLSLYLDKLFVVISIAFCGFTFGSIVFIEFGKMSWASYLNIARFFGIIGLLFLVAKIVFELSNRKNDKDFRAD